MNNFSEFFDPISHGLSIKGLLSVDKESQDYIIRYWLQRLNKPLPSTKKLKILRESVLFCRQDAAPVLSWKNVEIRRFNDYLYAMSPLKSHDPSSVYGWNLREDFILPNELGIISLADLREQGLNLSNLQQVTIRFRQGGERCRLPKRAHNSSLKKLFQQWRVPPWQRDRVPLLYSGNELQAIIGHTVCWRI